MINHFVLNNLVLVETSEVHFGPKFNAITGETGAGKTALLEGISLALGARADTSLIRKGCDKAYVEVAFEIDTLTELHALLEEAGITFDPKEYLLIRREIVKDGKNRAFINCQMAPLPLLQKIGTHLIDLIGQHSHQHLRTHEEQRALIDLFGDLKPERIAFQSCYAHEKELQLKRDELFQLGLRKEREEDTMRAQLQDIETLNLKEGEEEELFQKHERLAHSQELCEKTALIIHALSESQSAILPHLTRLHKSCDSLRTYDVLLDEPTTLLHDAILSLNEVLHQLRSYEQKLDKDPNAFVFLENRLSAISRLKRKYGQNFVDIENAKKKLQQELALLENLADEMELLEEKCKKAALETQKAAMHLTKKRKITAEHMAKVLTEQLQSLNMPKAELLIEILPQPRSIQGDDHIQFRLMANAGELPGLVKEHASGGELSRLLFAIKIALAEKNNTPTLIFDEIDANVGGKTASIIGEKLKTLGKHRQVLCITHFPQTASKADEHFAVHKEERDARTLTLIKKLINSKERESEILRMTGGE